jgi:thiol-disulfide isomerase/thioredoxin
MAGDDRIRARRIQVMGRLMKRTWTALLLGGGIASAATALGADRSAAEILKALDAVKPPSFDAARRSDQNYIREIQAQYQQAAAKRDELILELLRTDPNHDRLPILMIERWRRLPLVGPNAGKLDQELDDILAHTQNPRLKLEAAFIKAQASLYKARASGTLDLSAVDAFIKLAPKDPRAANLLYGASVVTRDREEKTALESRIIKEYPDSNVAAAIQAVRRQQEALGKPFELEFTDAINGSTVSIKNLKGKVVVVDFWATWCGPCVAEMPHMKELYAKYHHQGVEFIGVSLDQPKDQGGLDRLKRFVKENEIAWPQYYQGNGWQSEFSSSWGIHAIPAMFVVDPDGKLFSVEARGHLDTMIPELLKKNSAGAGTKTGGE